MKRRKLMPIKASDIKKLREETGAGVMDCKKALTEAKGNYQKALELVKERGLAKAEKKADRETKEGYIASYVHATGKVGALVEILCETDFVARNEELRQLGKDIAMQVVAMNPEDLDELLAQEFIKDSQKTIETLVKEKSGKLGEKLSLSRFSRLEVGN